MRTCPQAPSSRATIRYGFLVIVGYLHSINAFLVEHDLCERIRGAVKLERERGGGGGGGGGTTPKNNQQPNNQNCFVFFFI